jgi:uncharacterized protein YgbK (DUF1537 family)
MTAGQRPYVFIGDDFTGASDTLATLANRNWRTRLFLDHTSPGRVEDEDLDAFGFATELRACSAEEIAAELEALLPTVTGLSPSVVHYKICSTFDSSVSTGNISTAVAVLEQHLEPGLTLVIGGQPSLGRFCAFGNLFACAADGQVYRIDRHPVMKSHPITPMAESDLRLHLARQGLSGLELVSLQDVARGPEAVRAAVDTAVASGNRRVLFDVMEEVHLDHIREAVGLLACAGKPLLVIGASSVAEAFAVAKGGAAGPDAQASASKQDATASCPTLIVAGSRSSVTAAQVSSAAGFQKRPVLPADFAPNGRPGDLAKDCRAALAAGNNLLVHLQPAVDYRHSGAELSLRLADLVTGLLDALPIRNLGIAGGDTSSVVARRLGLDSLSFEQRLGPGTAVCRTRSRIGARNGLRILFKGGQVGSPDVFDRFARTAPATP